MQLKTQSISGLAFAKDSPTEIANSISNIVNYGLEHPYGEFESEESIKNITLEMCQKYYDTYFAPNVAYLALVGDITKAEAETLVNKYLSGWKKKEVPTHSYKRPQPPIVRKVSVVDRTVAVQSEIHQSTKLLSIGRGRCIQAGQSTHHTLERDEISGGAGVYHAGQLPSVE